MTTPAPAASRFDEMPPSLPPDSRGVDPYVGSMVSIVGIIVVGFVVIGLGYHSVSKTVIEAGEYPGLVSGSIAGIAIVAIGCVLAVILHGRRSEAVLRLETQRVLQGSAAAVRALKMGGQA